ncbi:MAG: tRNA uridine-5-carboxymethylaminomethyl(34) synthesis GTPase MnmE, partial [Bacteroidaceae bacterium]|nr:tRNA uridine-5-carboxymethylaminomethyl(34) synthesis GTPase MnmE [Bacteroidaceae bacterium]
MNASEDTICAIATATGGAIGIVRVSGPQAIDIAGTVFSAPLADASPYTAHYGNIVSDGATIDTAIATVFRAPRSYTG